MNTARVRAALCGALAAMLVVTAPAVGFRLEGPNTVKAVGLFPLDPWSDPPFLHWDMREFPTCSIPYSYDGGTPDIAADGEFTAADAGFALWSGITPSVASWTRVPTPAGARPPGFLDGNNVVGWAFGFVGGQTGDDTWLVPAADQACGADVGAGTPIVGPGADGWLTTVANNCKDDVCRVFDVAGNAVPCACGTTVPNNVVLIAPGANGTLETAANNCGNAGADDAVIGGVIYDGGNGVIDTRLADDVYVGDQVTAGADGIVHTVPGGNLSRFIALTELFYDAPSGVILEADIALNDNYTWQSVADDATMAGHPDVEMIVAHEVGHMLGLHHANGLSSNDPTIAPLYYPLMSQYTYLNDDEWDVAPPFRACGSPLPNPRDVIIRPGPDGVINPSLVNNCGGGDDFWDRVTNRIRDGGDQTVDTFIAPDRALHGFLPDDENGVNFLYTPDLGDAPDPFVAGATFNRYPTRTRSAGGGRTLNGVVLATPARGPQHLFGWGATTYEWLGTEHDQAASECSPFLVDLDPTDVRTDPPGPRPDGVVWPPMPLERGRTYPVQVVVTQSGQPGRYSIPSRMLAFDGYFDFEGDGEFDVPKERVFWWSGTDLFSVPPWSDSFVPPAVVDAGHILLTFNLYVPHAAVDVVWSRLRLDWSEDEGLMRRISPDLYPTIGTAQFGEVEDHVIRTTRGPLPLLQCYEIRRAISPTRPAVTLVDQFGTVTASAERPLRLCAPAVRPPTPLPPEPMHLEAYRLRHGWNPVHNVEVTNDFGVFVVDVISPATLMVPTYKSLTPPPPISAACGNGVVDPGEDCDPPGAKQCPGNAPVMACQTNCTCPPPNGIDHFECYKVRPAKGQTKFVPTKNVQITDQFGAITVDLLRPERLCAPVSKDGESPGAETHPEHLFCYKTRAVPRFGNRTVVLNNQFGTTQAELLRRQELCVPSTKRLR